MVTIRFSLGYMEPPLFCTDVDHMGEVDIDDLQLSELLRYDLEYLDKVYQSTLDESYPPHSGFSSKDANGLLWRAFNKEAEGIYQRLSEELNGEYEVTYVPLNYCDRKIASVDSRYE